MISSPVAPSATGWPAAVDDREVPAVERQPDPHRALAGELGAAGDDGGLGRAVGVPDLAARAPPAGRPARAGTASPPMISSRTPASDSGGHSATRVGTVETTVTSFATSHGPTSMPLLTSARGAGTRQRAVPPGQPHLLAAGVEGHREPGHHPVADPQRIGLQEHPRLGVDERRRAAVGDRDALRRTGRAGGEDHPRVVVRGRAPRRSRGGPSRRIDHGLVVADDRGHVRLVEDQPGALVGVVDVDGDVRRAGRAGCRGSRRRGRWCPLLTRTPTLSPRPTPCALSSAASSSAASASSA